MNKMKNISRRGFLRVGVGIGLAGAMPSLLSSCAKEDAKKGLVGNLEVWSWSGALDSIEALAPAFNESYPDITFGFIRMGAGDAQAKLLTAVVAGAGAPDIGSADDGHIEQFINANYLHDLSDLMAPYKDDFIPHKLRSVTTDDGKILGVPWDGSPAAMMWRADLFEEYGISVDEIETWDDFIRVGKEVDAASNGNVKMLLMGRNDPEVWYIRMFHSLLGSSFFSSDGKVVTMDDDANIEAAAMIKKLWDAEIAHKDVTWDAQWGYMDNNRLMTVPHAVWMGAAVAGNASGTSGLWRVDKLPAFTKGGNRNATLSGSALMIPKQSKQFEAAWNFLEYCQCRPENQLLQYQDFFLFPSLKSTFKLPFFDQPVEFFGGQKAYRVYADVEENVISYRYTPYYVEAKSLANLAIQKILDGVQEPAKALKEAADALRSSSGLK